MKPVIVDSCAVARLIILNSVSSGGRSNVLLCRTENESSEYELSTVTVSVARFHRPHQQDLLNCAIIQGETASAAKHLRMHLLFQ